MQKLVKILLVVMMLTTLTNCATLISGYMWPLTVNSSPSGAKVEISDKGGYIVFNGYTPSTMWLRSGAGYFTPQSYNVKITMYGYDEKIITVKCTLNGWYIGNVIFGGMVGMLIVDPATGAMYRLETNYLDVTLSKLPTSFGKALNILNINDLPADLRAHLVTMK